MSALRRKGHVRAHRVRERGHALYAFWSKTSAFSRRPVNCARRRNPSWRQRSMQATARRQEIPQP